MNEPSSKPIFSFAVDEVAMAALRAQQNEPEPPVCNLCELPIVGAPIASGLFMWTRGDDVRYDEPPLCNACFGALCVTGQPMWPFDDEGV